MSSKHRHPLPETVFFKLERASDSPGKQVTDADCQGSAPEFLISQAGGGAENVPLTLPGDAAAAAGDHTLRTISLRTGVCNPGSTSESPGEY